MRKPVHDHKVLNLLNDKGPLNATEIGKALNIKNGFIYSILDRMRKQGLLYRDASKNYAVKSRSVSPSGETKVKEVKPVTDPRIEVLWGEVQSIDQRLDYLMAVKIHLVNRINEIKDAASRPTRTH